MRVVETEAVPQVAGRGLQEVILRNTGVPTNSASGCPWKGKALKSEEAAAMFLDFTLSFRFPQLTLLICSCFTAPILSWAEAGVGTTELPEVSSNGRVLEQRLLCC